mgnify:CR=1 FL=1
MTEKNFILSKSSENIIPRVVKIAIKEDTKNVQYSISLLKKYEPRFRFIFAGRKEYFLKLIPTIHLKIVWHSSWPDNSPLRHSPIYC